MTPGPDEDEIVVVFAHPTAGEMAKFFASLPPDTLFRVVDAETGWIIDFFDVAVDHDNVAWLEPCSSDKMSRPSYDTMVDHSNQGPT